MTIARTTVTSQAPTSTATSFAIVWASCSKWLRLIRIMKAVKSLKSKYLMMLPSRLTLEIIWKPQPRPTQNQIPDSQVFSLSHPCSWKTTAVTTKTIRTRRFISFKTLRMPLTISLITRKTEARVKCRRSLHLHLDQMSGETTWMSCFNIPLMKKRDQR